jgi:hypothetical protein
MNNIGENSKRFSQSHHSFKHFFNNCILNQLNLNNLQEKGINIYQKDEMINKYNNKNRVNKRFITNSQISNDKKKRNSSSNIILKRFLLGNDVVLPVKSIKDLETSNVPYYTFNNYNKGNPFNSLNNLSNIHKNKYFHIARQKTYDEYKTNKIKKKNINNFRKKIFANNNNESKKFLKTNYDLNRYDFIDFSNNSNINFDFKTRLNNNNKKDAITMAKESSSKHKSFKKINSVLSSKRLKKYNSNNIKKK